MATAYFTLTIVTAALVAFSSYALSSRRKFVMEPIERLRVPPSWWPWLATAKAAGAAGLVAGLAVPTVGVLAAICLIVYFSGAVVISISRRWYAHIPVPLTYVAPAVATLVVGMLARWPHLTLRS
ncbi:DoxX family protein [Mycobacterium colombiense]|uniref:Integral membrane protein n=1 Tax=Mycobacterium colombiense CECT 3035 TaxID=1041522 RepID=J5EHU3_9MYCO|nr:DoxX family protein [Mycobacterium colombiense]EJO90506.1 integral membrane protein [Mycobacterium colombiense CECT 3035]